MGNIPTLQEVKEYFKNAETVKCAEENKEVNITAGIIKDEHWFNNCVWVDIDEKIYDGGSVSLWSNDNGYAKILTYKQPAYTITKEQLLELENGFTLPKLKQWFPDVFENKLPIDFTGWCKTKTIENNKYLVYFENGCPKYGFNGLGKWFHKEKHESVISEDEYESTEQEVFEALKNESVKMGFKEGVYYKNASREEGKICKLKGCDFKIGFSGRNNFYEKNSEGIIFESGTWAEIIPTLTKKEAEEKLNCKIV